jgi:adenylylsulfate kinase
MERTKTFAICMTGISGSGKTTLAKAIVGQLHSYGVAVDVIDGDETRELIGGLFGHSKGERLKMCRVNQAIGWYLLRNNVSFVLAVVAPFAEIRSQFRQCFAESYIEVYVKASAKNCAARDIKGIYKQNSEGKMENLNGSDDIFEPPENSDIIIDTDITSIEEGCKTVVEYLRRNGFINEA